MDKKIKIILDICKQQHKLCNDEFLKADNKTAANFFEGAKKAYEFIYNTILQKDANGDW